MPPPWIKSGRSGGGGKTRSSAGAKPLHAHLLDYIADVFKPTLYPYRRATVVAQTSGTATKVALAGTGQQGIADGMAYPVLLGYSTTQMVDSYGLQIPGGPNASHDVLVADTRPGNPVIKGHLATSVPPQVPWISAVPPGLGLQSAAYGTYPKMVRGSVINPGVADPVVQAPQLSVWTTALAGAPATSVPTGSHGGLGFDTKGGLGISLATVGAGQLKGLSTVGGLGINVGSSMQVNTDGTLGVSLSPMSGSPLTFNNAAGQVGLNTGAGVGVDGSGKLYNTAPNLPPVAGLGIATSGQTITVNPDTNNGITLNGAYGVAVNPDTNHGIYNNGVNGVAVKVGAGLTYDSSGNIATSTGWSLAVNYSNNLLDVRPSSGLIVDSSGLKVDWTQVPFLTGATFSGSITAYNITASNYLVCNGFTFNGTIGGIVSDHTNFVGWLPIGHGLNTYYVEVFQ